VKANLANASNIGIEKYSEGGDNLFIDERPRVAGGRKSIEYRKVREGDGMELIIFPFKKDEGWQRRNAMGGRRLWDLVKSIVRK